MGSTANSERLLLTGSVGFALLAIGAGYYLARITRDAHWMNRAGAVIVAAEAVIALVEFRRRERLNEIRQRTLTRKIRARDRSLATARAIAFVEKEIRRAEFHVLMIAIILAMLGEILHGFGDLLLEGLAR